MLLGTLDASLLRNKFVEKRFYPRDGDGATSPKYGEQLEQAKEQQK